MFNGTGSSLSANQICVCIPTYKRPQMLECLLTRLLEQRTDGLFTYLVLVVDNDRDYSAKDLVMEIKEKAPIRIDYCIAERKNVAIARNVAVQNAIGEMIAFIDDDELPHNNWLLNLYRTYVAYKADGVLGPVKPVYDKPPPDWIVKGKLFERPSYETGLILDWSHTRTGNVLLKRSIFDEKENLFNPGFKHGEDKDFFRRVMKKGLIFVWCEEAPVFEKQTTDRFTRRYFLKRALIRGSVSIRHRCFSKVAIMRSGIAVVVYSLALPFLFFLGQPVFMKYLIKAFDHIGALLGALRVNVMRYLEREKECDEDNLYPREQID